MATYESTHGSVVHVDLYSEDLAATQAFYEGAFGWRFEPVEGMAYATWQAPNPPNGGVVAREDGPVTPPSTVFYVEVEDLDTAREAISEAGGELLVEETAVPGMGVFAVFRDPGGVVEAAWEDRYEGEPPEGGWPMLTDEPEPGSIVHFEHYTDDPGATQAFHEAVFGWEFEPVEGGGYTLARPPTPPFGGLMKVNEQMPAGTLAYLLVESAEDTCQGIEDAGGEVVREPFDVEGWGTMAVFRAPGGIVQALWESGMVEESAEGEADVVGA